MTLHTLTSRKLRFGRGALRTPFVVLVLLAFVFQSIAVTANEASMMHGKEKPDSLAAASAGSANYGKSSTVDDNAASTPDDHCASMITDVHTPSDSPVGAPASSEHSSDVAEDHSCCDSPHSGDCSPANCHATGTAVNAVHAFVPAALPFSILPKAAVAAAIRRPDNPFRPPILA